LVFPFFRRVRIEPIERDDALRSSMSGAATPGTDGIDGMDMVLMILEFTRS